MRLRVLVLGTVAAFAGLIALAGAACAHVTVDSPGATQGGYAVLTFRVPTESDTASTTGVKVQLPPDSPLASVLMQPHPGWTGTAVKAKLATPIKSDDGDVTEAVTEIDWKATAGGIAPGQFDQFMLSVGPLPKRDSMTFKVIQTYSDGKQVAWIEVPAEGSTAEPEHPAPVLKLAAATGETGARSSAPATSGSASSASVQGAFFVTKRASNTGPVVLSVIALVVALVAIGVALSLARRPGRGGRS